MYIERDEKYNLLYVGFRHEFEKGEVAETREVSPGTYLDFDPDGNLVGIEIVNTQNVLGKAVSDLRLSGELIGVKEAAMLVRKDRANFLRDMVGRPGFPDPVARVASGQLWFSRDVERYLRMIEDRSGNVEPGSHDTPQEGRTARLPYTGWEDREEDRPKSYRYRDHEQYEDHEVMDTSKSAPEEERPFDDEDHEVFRSDRDSSEGQESA